MADRLLMCYLFLNNVWEHAARSIYELYSDYVMKNPFYETEQASWGWAG